MSDHRIQWIALFLIVFATCALGVAELHNWQALKDFALTFGGGGVGILTGQKAAGGAAVSTTGGQVSIKSDNNGGD